MGSEDDAPFSMMGCSSRPLLPPPWRPRGMPHSSSPTASLLWSRVGAPASPRGGEPFGSARTG